MSPFESAIGPQFHHLQPQIRQLHGGRASRWQGQVTVVRSGGLAGAWIARVAGFPGSMDKAPFELTVSPLESGGERWVRDFDGHQTVSDLYFDAETGLRECFDGVALHLHPTVKVDALQIDVKSAGLSGWSLPRFAVPQSTVSIWQDEAGRYRFDIAASFSVFGQVIRYSGWLRPADQSGFVRRK